MKLTDTLMLLACLILAPLANAQTDDTLVIERPSQVIITQSADTLSIQVAGSQQNPNYRYSREVVLADDEEVRTTSTQSRRSALGWDFSIIESEKKVRKLNGHIGPNLSVGWRFPQNKPAAMHGYSWKRSLEIDIALVNMNLTFGHSKYWYSMNWGLGINEMTLTGDTRFNTDREGNLLLEDYPAGTKPDYSSIFWSYVNCSLSAHRRVCKYSNLCAALVCEMNGNPFCRSSYIDVDGKTSREAGEVTALRPFHFAFRLEYTTSDNAGFYVKYSPFSEFHKGCGPDYTPLSLGLAVGF